VESYGSRIVQFSHFSVKEFLTATRLATSSGDTSQYHILLEPAHTILVQACLSVLLQVDDCVEQSGVRNSSPLARYAAKHWATHAQDEKVSSCLRKAMEYLFDPDKPYFAAWLQLHDIDSNSPEDSTFYQFTPRSKSDATPLYYAALCGFQDLVEHLTVNDPKQVNATSGYYLKPLVAALATGHFQTAKFLSDKLTMVHTRMSGALRTRLHWLLRLTMETSRWFRYYSNTRRISMAGMPLAGLHYMLRQKVIIIKTRISLHRCPMSLDYCSNTVQT
jgi:hypothetical protein